MEEISKVVVIGSEEEGARIGKLFSTVVSDVVMRNELGPEALADADIVLEALSGDIEERKKLLYQCDEKAPPDTILATTASRGITEIATATGRPEGVVGLNFTFNPFQEGCVVQIVKGLETSETNLETCRSLVERAGATAVLVEDSPGLVLDRVMAAVINEAATMYAEKEATIDDIDTITKVCLNWPMGPFEFADTIGVDNVLATLEILSQQAGSRFVPCRLLRQMVTAGRLGKKTGKGFYAY